MATVYQRPGTKKLWLRYWDGAKEVRCSAGTEDWSAAEAELARRLEHVRKPCPTWDTAVVTFFEHADIKPKTRQNYQASLRYVTTVLQGKRLDEITVETIKRLITHRRADFAATNEAVDRWNRERLHELATKGKTDKVRPKRHVDGDVSIRRDLAFVSTVFSYAQENLENADIANPVKLLSKRRLKNADRRRRFLTPVEFRTLLRCCTTSQQRRVLFLAVETGMRRGEIERLTWDQVDLKRREIHLDVVDTKTGAWRVIPLSKVALGTLSAQPRHKKIPQVFWHGEGEEASAYYDFTNWWDGVMRRAEKRGVTDIRFHDLRRTFGSWWLQRGGEWEILRQLLGHSQEDMTDIYGRWRTSDLHRGLSELRSTVD